MTEHKQLTVDGWVKRLKAAYESGIIGDFDVEYGPDGYIGDLGFVNIDNEPVFLRSKTLFWHSSEKRWEDEDRAIAILPKDLQGPSEDEWIDIWEKLRRDLHLREHTPENRKIVDMLRERRFKNQPIPSWIKSNEPDSDT